MNPKERQMLIAQLRNDRRLTADAEGWTPSDRRDIDAAIKACIDAGDDEALQAWARDMAFEREMRVSFAPRLRAFEASVRAAAEAKRRMAA